MLYLFIYKQKEQQKDKTNNNDISNWIQKIRRRGDVDHRRWRRPHRGEGEVSGGRLRAETETETDGVWKTLLLP